MLRVPYFSRDIWIETSLSHIGKKQWNKEVQMEKTLVSLLPLSTKLAMVVNFPLVMKSRCNASDEIGVCEDPRRTIRVIFLPIQKTLPSIDGLKAVVTIHSLKIFS